ncbi:MAG: hypothetical protein Q7V58_10255 [Actinomycetota bacterium]|nr:hypothetical protein [Actinomycetota bacterium]
MSWLVAMVLSSVMAGPAVPTATIATVTFTMEGYANLVRIVPEFQLGKVYLDGHGLLNNAAGTVSGGTSTRNDYLNYPEAAMETQVIGWAYSASPHGTRKTLVLTVRVTASNDSVDCVVGTVGTVTLIDDDRRMKNGQRRDKITQIYPSDACPSFVQGVSNKDAAHLGPTSGGRGGGQWAEVEITTTTG